MNILLIDDDVEDTDLFCKAMSELFPEAMCIAVNVCPKDIADTVISAQPDIIFMDGHMYPTNGKECLSQLNQIVDRKQVKIVIHSGSLSPSEMSEFIQLGVDDILFKPSSYDTLKSNIMNILAKYNLASHL
jgi:DNA-binding NarL/FixJ family response regulator